MWAVPKTSQHAHVQTIIVLRPSHDEPSRPNLGQIEPILRNIGIVSPHVAQGGISYFAQRCQGDPPIYIYIYEYIPIKLPIKLPIELMGNTICASPTR